MKNQHKKLKMVLLIIVSVVLSLLIAGDIFMGNALVSFAIQRTPQTGKTDVAPDAVTSEETARIIEANKLSAAKTTNAWLAETKIESVSVRSDDGLQLKGSVINVDEESHHWAIVIHGYTLNREAMNDYAYYYAQRGYHLLLPDLRAHGESEGEYFGMGWLDRKDIPKWINLIISRDPEAEIILHGVSMGAAAAMMTAGEKLPENVKAIVEDCGYTSVWDIFADELWHLHGLPPVPVLNTMGLFSRIRAGYDISDASSLEQIKKATVPILFIHGSKDNFVATDMVYQLYDACPTQKELFIVENAGHAESFYFDPVAYFKKVFAFLDDTVCQNN